MKAFRIGVVRMTEWREVAAQDEVETA